tara:strand:+ start:115 stop:360 length:246 start_codon:yes stop_codon:yes gene_type:complete
MPKVFVKDGHKFFFFSNEGKPLEPMHIHVRKAEAVAKFWMYPEVRLESAYSFSSKELKWPEKQIEQNRTLIEDTWNGYFNQ